jgi:hypothetical protein
MTTSARSQRYTQQAVYSNPSILQMAPVEGKYLEKDKTE